MIKADSWVSYQIAVPYVVHMAVSAWYIFNYSKSDFLRRIGFCEKTTLTYSGSKKEIQGSVWDWQEIMENKWGRQKDKTAKKTPLGVKWRKKMLINRWTPRYGSRDECRHGKKFRYEQIYIRICIAFSVFPFAF